MKKNLTPVLPKILILFSIFFSFAANSNAQPGNALNFDGATNYIVTGAAGGVYTAGSSYTKEAWVLYAGPNFYDAENIISSKDPFWVNGGKLGAANNYDVATGPPADVEDPALFPINHWVYVAVTYDAPSTTLKLYKNGIVVATNPSVVASVSGQQYIGGYDDAGVKYIWKGNLDQVRVYNTALTQANIQADMLSTTPAVPANLLGDYNFDVGTAGGTNTGLTTLPDASTAANNGTLTNFPLTGTGGNWIESYAMVVPVATAATSVTAVSFDANWTPPTIGTVDNYIIDVSLVNDFSTAITGSPFTVAFGTNTVAVTGLSAATTYYYRVSADKTSVTGQGAFSNTITTISTLPVNSLSFNVSKASGSNLLQWSTGSELNTRYFELQRSTTGSNFTTIATINASGNSSTTKNYQYSDPMSLNPAPVYYYRLKMVDINGNFTYSDILLIKTTKGSVVTVYPNPAQDKVIINVTDKSLMNTNAVLTDVGGKLLQNVLITQTVTTIDIHNYERGVYMLRLANGESIKLVKE